MNLVSPDGKNLLRSNKSINLPLYQHTTPRVFIIIILFFLKPEGLHLTLFILLLGCGCISEGWTKILGVWLGRHCSQPIAAKAVGNGEQREEALLAGL